MTEKEMKTMVPEHAASIADALADLAIAIGTNRKAGMGLASEVTADITVAVSKLSSVISSFEDLATEANASPLGFAEAFTLAGFKIARALTGK